MRQPGRGDSDRASAGTDLAETEGYTGATLPSMVRRLPGATEADANFTLPRMSERRSGHAEIRGRPAIGARLQQAKSKHCHG